MAKGSGARARYKAMLADVQQRVSYALYSGNLTNPYPIEDKRHARFAQTLVHDQEVSRDFDETHVLMGGRLEDLGLRHHDDPGPVEDLVILGERWKVDQARRTTNAAWIDDDF